MINTSPQNNMTDSIEEPDTSYLGQTIADIIRREEAHELPAEKLLCIQTPDGPVFARNTDDQCLLDYMPQLQRLYARLMADDESPLEATVVRWAQCPGFRLTKLGKEILLACNYFSRQEEDGRNWQRAYAHHEFHPVIAVMFRAVMRWWMPICGWGEHTVALIDGEPERETLEALRHLVGFVRRVCRSQAFWNLLHDHERKAEDNFRSGCDYITKVFECHSRLLVLRIDLYFRPDARGWGYSQAANEALKNYLRALRLGRIVPGHPYIIIKRENGISRGMHYHVMVLLDGHLHRNAFYLTQRMGEAWMKRVGKDKGSYFNCYANKDRYRYNGLGLVHVSDTEKLIGIRIAIWYMSKQDSELKVDDSEVKNFWRGWKVKGDSNRGAPRKNGDGMRLVRSLLGGERSKYPPGFEPPKNARWVQTAALPRGADAQGGRLQH